MKKMHVYSHTHWDYEWYFTASESIIQLIYHMDEVISALESGTLKTYLLDSQVSILEEYLNMMPEKEPVVRKLVEEGKLMIGPWYTQSDELIISGESLARNLWYGISYARELGNCMMIGYLPDSFGQGKDMPKLYNGFNIREALFWRGVPNDVCKQREFYWHSADGSEVLCYHIRDGYFYGGNLIYTDDVDKVEKRILNGASTTHQLLPLGGDQRYVDFNLQERLAYYNERSTHDIQYFESDLKSFFNELRSEEGLPHIEGEFIDASVSKIHHSIYSSRYDHKQLNDTIERRLIYQLEPFMVMQQQMGISPKTEVLKKLWKKVLLNHAHDSACGCNSDATNDAILQRLQDCEQMSSMLLDYQVRKLSESLSGIRENDIVFYNTLPYTSDEVRKVSITTKQKSFCILDEAGCEIAYDCQQTQRVYSGSIRKDPSSYDEELYYYQSEIMIRLFMKPMSMRILHITACDSHKQQVQKLAALENAYYKITWNKGMLQLKDKTTGRILEDFLYVEDGGDEGDTYDYSWPTRDRIYKLRFQNAKAELQSGDIADILTLRGTWLLPQSLQERESDQCTQELSYELQLQLDHKDLIRCELHVNNTAAEHRMRVICRGLSSSDSSIADTPFGTIRRKHDPKHMDDWREAGYREEPSPIYPFLHHVSNGDGPILTCFSKGIKEYEILRHTDIALTLFRSVPLLGKPDLNRRPGIASGNEFKYIPTPKSELRQHMSFAFALCYRREYHAMELQKAWLCYANAPLYYQLQEMNRFVNTQKYFVTHPYPQAIQPLKEGLLNMDDSTVLQFSSLYPLDEKHAVLRVYNSLNTTVSVDHLHCHTKHAQLVNMLHEKIADVRLEQDELTVQGLHPEEIRTYKIIVK